MSSVYFYKRLRTSSPTDLPLGYGNCAFGVGASGGGTQESAPGAALAPRVAGKRGETLSPPQPSIALTVCSFVDVISPFPEVYKLGEDGGWKQAEHSNINPAAPHQ